MQVNNNIGVGNSSLRAASSSRAESNQSMALPSDVVDIRRGTTNSAPPIFTRADLSSFTRADLSNFTRADLSSFTRSDLTRPSNAADSGVFFPARAPGGGSSEYIGNSTNVVRHSSESWSSGSEIITSSSDIITSSSEIFKSSDDILEYLRSHPDFQKMPPSSLDAIIAAILSGLAIVGGVAISVLTAGAATPLTIVSSSFLVGAGVTGMQNAVRGAVNRDFSWGDFGTEIAIQGGLTLVTFGAGYGAGNLAGIALAGKVSDATLKVVGGAAGALAGAGVRTGTHIVINRVQGKPITVVELVLDGVFGAIEGAMAGFLAVNKFVVHPLANQPADPVANQPPGLTEEQIATLARNLGHTPEDVHEILGFVQTLNEDFKLALLRGFWGRGEVGEGAFSFMHILTRHSDVFTRLGFTAHEISHALEGSLPMIEKMASRFLEVASQTPVAIGMTRGAMQLYYAIGQNRWLRVTASAGVWRGIGGNAHAIIQSNLVDKIPIKSVFLHIV
jgi:hypothetical protein